MATRGMLHAMLLVWATCLLGAASPALAATLLVANNGEDVAGCGPVIPCRSINQAIRHAAAGDRILVGPGFYGDLDGDRVLSGPGEEVPDDPTAPGRSSCHCVILVDKPVRLFSTHGAGATIINGPGEEHEYASSRISGVLITASGAVLGGATRGFTIQDTSGSSVWVEADRGVRVQGNVVRPGPFYTSGLYAIGTAHVVVGNVATQGERGFSVGGTGHVIAQNLAIGNSKTGFSIGGGSHVVRDNVARLNKTSGGIPPDCGFSVSGDGHLVRGNLAADNGAGFCLGGSPTLVGNVASGNGTGFWVAGDGTVVTFTGNVASGNGPGFYFPWPEAAGSQAVIQDSAAVGNSGAGIRVDAGTAVVRRSNIFGNGRSYANCGVRAHPGVTVAATDNYWGAPGGPGADPADAVCDNGGEVIVPVFPVATTPFTVAPTAGQVATDP